MNGIGRLDACKMPANPSDPSDPNPSCKLAKNLYMRRIAPDLRNIVLYPLGAGDYTPD
jgi:hypothetical protein